VKRFYLQPPSKVVGKRIQRQGGERIRKLRIKGKLLGNDGKDCLKQKKWGQYIRGRVEAWGGDLGKTGQKKRLKEELPAKEKPPPVSNQEKQTNGGMRKRRPKKNGV